MDITLFTKEEGYVAEKGVIICLEEGEEANTDRWKYWFEIEEDIPSPEPRKVMVRAHEVVGARAFLWDGDVSERKGFIYFSAGC